MRWYRSAVVVFFLCVGIMVLVSRMERPSGASADVQTLTVDWTGIASSIQSDPRTRTAHIALTAVLGAAIVGLWYHFS
jgi:hypothetical protein